MPKQILQMLAENQTAQGNCPWRYSLGTADAYPETYNHRAFKTSRMLNGQTPVKSKRSSYCTPEAGSSPIGKKIKICRSAKDSTPIGVQDA
jgi:hypothetical protein